MCAWEPSKFVHAKAEETSRLLAEENAAAQVEKTEESYTEHTARLAQELEQELDEEMSEVEVEEEVAKKPKSKKKKVGLRKRVKRRSTRLIDGEKIVATP